MKYFSTVRTLLGDKSEELGRKLLSILDKDNGKQLLNFYLNEAVNQLNAPGYPDFTKIQKYKDNKLIYNLLTEREPLSTEKIIDELKDSGLGSSLKFRTHMSARIRELLEYGFVGVEGYSGYSKLYTTSEKAVKSKLIKSKTSSKDEIPTKNLTDISRETELKPIYVLRVIQKTSKK